MENNNMDELIELVKRANTLEAKIIIYREQKKQCEETIQAIYEQLPHLENTLDTLNWQICEKAKKALA